MIMSWNDENDDTIVFKEETIKDLKDLIQRMIDSSPSNSILFSTDYQFGPKYPEEYLSIQIK